jgi:hypothetical protein
MGSARRRREQAAQNLIHLEFAWGPFSLALFP